jgi:2-dehydro-3-deoxygluconokinase
VGVASTVPLTGPGRVVCFGELLLRLSPPARELPFQSPRLAAHFGGAEANVAASLAILGHESAMVSALPDNPIGRACTGELRRHGVDTSNIRFGDGRMGLYLLVPGAMQRPAEVTYDRAGSVFAITPSSAYDWAGLLKGARWLHVSGINLALGAAAADAALAAVRAARAAGVSVSFDCNHRAKLWGSRAAEAPTLLREMLSAATLAFGDERDLALILGGKTATAQDDASFADGARTVFASFPGLQLLAATRRRHEDVATQLLSGRLATRGDMLGTRAFRLAGIVDRIGSGDAFAAGLLHGLLRGMPTQRALDFATAAACLKHSVPGDVNLLGESDMLGLLDGEGLDVRR